MGYRGNPCIGVKSLVYDVGVNDATYPVKVRGVQMKSYSCWLRLLTRCYNSNLHKLQKTYEDCYVCEDWKYFTKFKEWYDENFVEGWHLDKDLLVEGNKMYSPETCIYIPQQINCMFAINKKNRGKYPLGVSFKKSSNRFVASYKHEGKVMHIGYFDCPYEAREAYKFKKKEVLLDFIPKALKEYEDYEKVCKLLLDIKTKVESEDFMFFKEEK